MPREASPDYSRLLIVTSRGHGVGKGHEKRCREMLKRFKRFRECRLADGFCVRGAGGRVHAAPGWSDGADIRRIARELKAGVILFDTPLVPDRGLARLREEIPGCCFVSYENYFNDLSLFDLNLDMGYDRTRERTARGVRGSLEFTVFDSAVHRHERTREGVSPQPTALVSFGGTDLHDSSSIALRLLDRLLGGACRVHLVVGPYFVEERFLRSFASELPAVTVHDAPESLYGLMEQCVVGIVNAGTTWLESLAVGRPAFPGVPRVVDRAARLAQMGATRLSHMLAEHTSVLQTLADSKIRIAAWPTSPCQSVRHRV